MSAHGQGRSSYNNHGGFHLCSASVRPCVLWQSAMEFVNMEFIDMEFIDMALINMAPVNTV